MFCFPPVCQAKKHIPFFLRQKPHTPADRKEHNCLSPQEINHHPFVLTFPLGAVTNELCCNMPSLLTCLFLAVTNDLFLANCPDNLNQSSMKSEQAGPNCSSIPQSWLLVQTKPFFPASLTPAKTLVHHRVKRSAFPFMLCL